MRSAGIGANLTYGDSQRATFVKGLVGFDSVSVGGAILKNQSLLAVNQTNTTMAKLGLAGILGLGFPLNRYTDFRLLQGATILRKVLQCHHRGIIQATTTARQLLNQFAL